MSPLSHNTLPNTYVSEAQRIEEAAPSRVQAFLSILSLLLEAIRPREWIKNAFVFAALFFSKNLLNVALLPRACLAFGLYCMAAGGVYLMNDIKDRAADRRHPQKRTRPIASGALPLVLAAPAAVVLLLLAMGGAWLLRPALGLTS